MLKLQISEKQYFVQKNNVIMARLTGQQDEQFAAGVAIGGTASLIGPTAVGVAEVAAAKLGRWKH